MSVRHSRYPAATWAEGGGQILKSGIGVVAVRTGQST